MLFSITNANPRNKSFANVSIKPERLVPRQKTHPPTDGRIRIQKTSLGSSIAKERKFHANPGSFFNEMGGGPKNVFAFAKVSRSSYAPGVLLKESF
ncbi:hypothetical protein JTE90_016994 [Oedothorax gibbosus]|uniref:Uncharacterized protein n=1 Tax=Oedothorax gibbosus TaxID=931172 RepID=A0AAV6UMP8_9ARAC|nr:hypothetical protein JTE90_016994 [Oedothorax gibbosus]